MTVVEYLKATGINIHQLSQRAEISYPVLHGHVRYGKKLSREIAERLQERTGGKITAIEALYPEGPAAPQKSSTRKPAA